MESVNCKYQSVAAIVSGMASLSLLTAQVEELTIDLTGSEATLTHTGDESTTYGVGILNDAFDWEVDALSAHIGGNTFQHVDFDRLYAGDRRLYQIFGPISAIISDWMQTYTLPDLPDFDRMSPVAGLSWNPFPSAGAVTYTVEIFPMIEEPLTGELGFVARPVVSVGGLLFNSYHLTPADPVLDPDTLYAVRVTADSREGIYRGRPVPFRSALSPIFYGGIPGGPVPPPPGPFPPGPGPAPLKSGSGGHVTDWGEVAKLIGDIRKGKEAAM